MAYGIQVFNADGTVAVGMSDFTLSKIFEASFSAQNSPPETTFTIPGYDPSTCIIVVSPVIYYDSYRVLPYYVEKGGEEVVIKRGDGWSQYNRPPDCLIEAYRIL